MCAPIMLLMLKCFALPIQCLKFIEWSDSVKVLQTDARTMMNLLAWCVMRRSTAMITKDWMALQNLIGVWVELTWIWKTALFVSLIYSWKLSADSRSGAVMSQLKNFNDRMAKNDPLLSRRLHALCLVVAFTLAIRISSPVRQVLPHSW